MLKTVENATKITSRINILLFEEVDEVDEVEEVGEVGEIDEIEEVEEVDEMFPSERASRLL